MARRLSPLNALRAFEAAVVARPRSRIAAFHQWPLAETAPLRNAA